MQVAGDSRVSQVEYPEKIINGVAFHNGILFALKKKNPTRFVVIN